MVDDTGIVDGVAAKLLLAGLVLASAAVGTSGLVPATPATLAGDADGVAVDPADSLSLPASDVPHPGGRELADGEAPGLPLPRDDVSYATVGATPRLPFPVEGPTPARDRRTPDVRPVLAEDAGAGALARDVRSRFRSRDADPYAFPPEGDADQYRAALVTPPARFADPRRTTRGARGPDGARDGGGPQPSRGSSYL
jgi:hypothetical protein